MNPTKSLPVLTLSVERKATWHETVKNATERFTAIKCCTVAAAESHALENIQNPGGRNADAGSQGFQRSQSGGTSASNWTNTAGHS